MKPLAARLRPSTFDDYVGQNHLLDEGKPLRRVIESGDLHSMIFWGPPGTGKTTLAQMIAGYTNAKFVTLSAVLAGVKDVRAAVDAAKQLLEWKQQRTVLFIDEIHRFNKSQQDAFLPFVEDGTVFLIGATTENPSFELNNALLSRARVYVLKSLSKNHLEEVLDRALSDTENGLGEMRLTISEEAKAVLVNASDGDARRLLTFLEIASDLADHGDTIDMTLVGELIGEGVRQFDQQGEQFYDQISALHKSVRGSCPDASVYWLARMLDGGCDPLYIARRVARMASEDIGNADPRALDLAMNAWQAIERLGQPEGELALFQAVIYMACAAKSNAVYMAMKQAQSDVRKSGTASVPVHLRNAPTKLMKELGNGKRYRYAHDEPDAYAAGENYWPEELNPVNYYQPVDRGLEKKIQEKLNWLRQKDEDARKS